LLLVGIALILVKEHYKKRLQASDELRKIQILRIRRPLLEKQDDVLCLHDWPLFAVDDYLVEFEVDDKSEEPLHDHVLIYIPNLIEVVFLTWLEHMSRVVLQNLFKITQSHLSVLFNRSNQPDSLL
jgi:hypothetical protein